MNALPRRLRSEAGIALPFIAVAALAIISMAAVGVETGRIALVATEAQNAADIAATAAAGHYVDPQGSAMTPRQIAEAAIAANMIDRYSVQPSHLTVLELGNYTDAGGFISNLAPFNAARAQITIDVQNVMMAGLGHPTSHVVKEAIAGFSPTAGGRPTIPLVIGECLINADCNEDACQPTLTQVPNPDENSAWTGFFAQASTDQISAYFPDQCPRNGNGTTEQAPYIHVGDDIYLNTGQEEPLLRQVKCMFDNGITEIVVPIVSCDTSYNQARPVLGFATFEITGVRATGGNKGIDIHGLTSADNGPGGGPISYGSGTIVLVQ